VGVVCSAHQTNPSRAMNVGSTLAMRLGIGCLVSWTWDGRVSKCSMGWRKGERWGYAPRPAWKYQMNQDFTARRGEGKHNVREESFPYKIQIEVSECAARMPNTCSRPCSAISTNCRG